MKPMFGIVIVIALQIITGCGTSSSKGPAPVVKSTAFLGDISNLTPDSRGVLVYRHPTRKASGFAKFWIEKMEVQFAKPAEAKKIDPAAMKEFMTFWRNEVETHVKSLGLAVAESGGENTIHLRMALTNLQPAKSGTSLTGGTTASYVEGEATFEGEGVDAVTGERIVATIGKAAWRRHADTNRLELAKDTINHLTDVLFKEK